MKERKGSLTPLVVYLSKGDEELFKKFEEIRWKERISLSELTRKAMEEYVKKHGEGNPSFQLDQFAEQGMKATPAFMSNYAKWKNHFINESTEKDIEEYKRQIIIVDKAYSDAVSIRIKTK